MYFRCCVVYWVSPYRKYYRQRLIRERQNHQDMDVRLLALDRLCSITRDHCNSRLFVLAVLFY